MNTNQTTLKHDKVRASIAHKCTKCLVDYLENGTDESQSSAALMGTLIHNGFIPYYEAIIGKRIVYRERALENDYFTGHIDGYIKKDKKLFELKTVNSFSFQKIKEPYESHITQVNIYMKMLDTKEAHIVYLNRDSGEHKAFDVEFSPLIYNSVVDKVKEAISLAKKAADPKTIELDEFESCDAYCKFKTKTFEKLPEGEKLSTQIEGLSSLYTLRVNLDEQIKGLSSEKKEVEEKIKTLMLENEARKIPDLKISFVEINRKSFDTKSFKADNPEVYEAYLKTTKSQYLKFS